MIKKLTSLRGVFILFIFLHHCGIYPGGGSMSVAFFFVLSGFSMALGYKEKVMQTNFSYKHYLLRRFIKLYPLHWITLVADIPLVLMSTLHWWLIPVLFINAALLQALIPVQSVYFSYNAVSWFLADIMFFALVFPFIIRKIISVTSLNRVKILVVMMAIYVAIAEVVPPGLKHAILYISPFVRLSDFILGIILGLFYLDVKSKIEGGVKICWFKPSYIEPTILVLIVLLIVESCFLAPQFELLAPLYWPIIAIIIFISAISTSSDSPILENKYIYKLGEYSYTIFLVHRLVIRYLEKLLMLNKCYLVLISLVVTIVVSIMLNKYILNPITKWLKKKYLPSMIVHS